MKIYFSFLLSSIALYATNAQINNIPAPTRLKIVEDSVTDTGFWVTWDLVSKADSYKVILSPPEIGAIGVGNGIIDKFTAIDGLAPDTEYKITIIPVKGSDEGTPAVVTQRTALPASSSLFVVSDSITATRFVVGWAEVKDAESYTLEVNPSTGVSGAGRGLYKTNANLLGLTPNTLYTITVRPINWVGLGAPTTIRQLTKLPAPSNVRVITETISHNTMSVHWDPVVGADTYEVTVTPPDGVTGAGEGITSPYVILRNLQADTQYLVRVAATNAAGLSEFRQAIAKTLSVCYAKGVDFTEDIFTIKCPARCARNQEHVYGTREYTADSYICAAAVHDGRYDDNVGGEVVVKKRPGLPHYVGTGKNGVLSKDYGSWHQSFVFGLQVPQNFRVQPGSVKHISFTLLWDAVNGADAYRLSVRPDYGVVGARPGIEGTKATLSNLRSDVEYTVYLTATNSLETSEAAVLKQFTALAGPARVDVIQESVGHDRMNVSWFPVPGASHYVLDVSAGTTSFTHESRSTSTMIDGLMSGTRYRIAVRAANSVGPGGPSFVTQYTKLATPKNVNVESVYWQRMHIQWDAVPGATHYTVYTIPAGLRNVSQTTDTPWIWIEDLFPNTMYEIRIQAVNLHEKSRSVSLKQMTALGQPKNLIVSNKTHNSLTLTWNKVKNANSYFITILSIDGRHKAEDERKSTKFTLTGLEGRTEYKIKVIPRNKIGDGQPATIEVTTLIPPPSNLFVRGSNVNPSQIEIAWSQMPEATGYYISVFPQGQTSGTGLVTVSRGVVGGLRIGVLYTVKVMSVIGSEKGMNATRQFATGLPSPRNVRVRKEYILATTLFVEWDRVTLAESYNLTFQNLRTSIIKPIYNIRNNTMLLDNLDPGTRYRITVYAVGKSRQAGETIQLGSIGASTVGMTRLETPMNLLVFNVTDSAAKLSWTRVKFATHYDVFIEPNPGINGTGRRKYTEAWLSGMMLGEEYTASVYAINIKNNATSDPQITEIVTGSPAIDDGWNMYNGDIDNEPSDVDLSDIPGPKTKEPKPDPDADRQTQQHTWIVIVIIVACIGLILLLALVPCLWHCFKVKPLLKCSGFCGCCAPCSDAGCCGCTGCCNASPKGEKMEEDDDVDYPPERYTPSFSRRDMRTQSRQSYLAYH